MGKLTRILFALFLLALGFSGGQYYLQRIYERQLEAGYRQALYEFACHWQEVADEIGRSRLAVTSKQRHLIAANIRRLAYAAQSDMGGLPRGEIQMEKIAGLLAEAFGQSFLYEQNETVSLEGLFERIQEVNGKLQAILLRKAGEKPWVEWPEYLGAEIPFPHLLGALAAINAELQEGGLPSVRGEIKGVEINRTEALEIARAFWDQGQLNFLVTNEGKGTIPAFTVEGKDEERHVIIEVSKKGGLVLWMTVVQEIPRAALDTPELVRRGKEALQERGFANMHVTDAQVLLNRVTLTFVPERQGILHYAEPIKVQLSALDGSVVGFWAVPYYLAERGQRPSMKADAGKIWETEEKIASGAQVLARKLALIQKENREEVLTKRLGVKYGQEYYLIYINAASGEEEQIMRVSSPDFF